MRHLITAALAICTPLSGLAQNHRAGDFDYYVLALSWSPNWCASAGDKRGTTQCDAGQKVDFNMHGLWPQYEEGWPSNCRTAERDPSRRESEGMADVMGSGGLAWYQWQKHGRCTGLSATEYYQTSRDALETVTLPDYFVDLDKDISIPPALIEQAFMEYNPTMNADGITVTCRGEDLQEVRICLTKDLQPRDCAPDVRQDCSREAVIMDKVR